MLFVEKTTAAAGNEGAAYLYSTLTGNEAVTGLYVEASVGDYDFLPVKFLFVLSEKAGLYNFVPNLFQGVHGNYRFGLMVESFFL